MFRFVNRTAVGLPEKRKQVSRACIDCRRKKRKCGHSLGGTSQGTDSTGNTPSPHKRRRVSTDYSDRSTIDDDRGSQRHSDDNKNGNQQAEGYKSPSDGSRRTAARTSPGRTHSARDRSDEPVGNAPGRFTIQRFIGDVSPEGLLLAAANPSTATRPSAADNIGIWIMNERTGNATKIDDKSSLRLPRSNAFGFSDMAIQQLLLPHLEDQCLACVPPEADYNHLKDIYMTKVHPIFPIVDEQALAGDMQEPGVIAVKQCICLAAAFHREAAAFLRLTVGSAVLPSVEFVPRITTAVRAMVYLGLVTDKAVLIQIHALLSLFVQSTDGGDLPTQHVGRAVCHAHSLGLQIANRAGIQDSQKTETLYCCVWALDRINNALFGRPELMHDRDSTRDLEKAISDQPPAFQLFLRSVRIYDKVVTLYRPANSALASMVEDFPDFEQLVTESDASRISMPILASIEMFYHSCAMLSHRIRPSDETLRTSPAFVRQKLSAARVTAIAGQDFEGQLSLLPFIPNAVALSLGTAYRELRYSKIPMFQSKAKAHLQENCRILHELSPVFSCAIHMADLAVELLREMDKVLSTASLNRSAVNGRAGGGGGDGQSRRGSVVVPAGVSASGEGTTAAEAQGGIRGGADGARPEADVSGGAALDGPMLADGFFDAEFFSRFSEDFDLAAIDEALCGTMDLSYPLLGDLGGAS